MTSHEPDLPRLVLDTHEAARAVGDPDTRGAAWRLDPVDRELDANLVALPPGESIGEHVGADVDALIHVVAGTGTLRTEGDDVLLSPGALVYLPRGSRRAILAGSGGLRYLSVHRRKESRPLMPRVV